jgi:hypothetical protein
VSQLALGRAGRQFFLADCEEDASPLQLAGLAEEQTQQPQQPQQGQQQQQQQAAGSAGSQERRRREPLLYRLTEDHPQEVRPLACPPPLPPGKASAAAADRWLLLAPAISFRMPCWPPVPTIHASTAGPALPVGPSRL